MTWIVASTITLLAFLAIGTHGLEISKSDLENVCSTLSNLLAEGTPQTEAAALIRNQYLEPELGLLQRIPSEKSKKVDKADKVDKLSEKEGSPKSYGYYGGSDSYYPQGSSNSYYSKPNSYYNDDSYYQSNDYSDYYSNSNSYNDYNYPSTSYYSGSSYYSKPNDYYTDDAKYPSNGYYSGNSNSNDDYYYSSSDYYSNSNSYGDYNYPSSSYYSDSSYYSKPDSYYSKPDSYYSKPDSYYNDGDSYYSKPDSYYYDDSKYPSSSYYGYSNDDYSNYNSYGNGYSNGYSNGYGYYSKSGDAKVDDEKTDRRPERPSTDKQAARPVEPVKAVPKSGTAQVASKAPPRGSQQSKLTRGSGPRRTVPDIHRSADTDRLPEFFELLVFTIVNPAGERQEGPVQLDCSRINFPESLNSEDQDAFEKLRALLKPSETHRMN